MARYIVLSFEDNEEAEQFIEAIKMAQSHKDLAIKGRGYEVEGVFAKPTKFCEHSNVGGCSQGKRYTSWVQGKKYGWWVCRVCAKPSSVPTEEQRMRASVSQGTNLLSQEENALDDNSQTTGLSPFTPTIGAFAHG